MVKKFIDSALICVLTLITVIAMMTFKIEKQNLPVNEVLDEIDATTNVDKPEGTGYIFDDFGKEINLPLDIKDDIEVNSLKGKNKKINLEDGIKEYFLKYSMMKFKNDEDYNISLSNRSKVYKTFSMDTQNKKSPKPTQLSQVKEYEKKLDYEDKMSLIKISKNFSISEINDIKRAIDSGASYEESRKILDMLKKRLDPEEYERLIKIVDKFQQ